MCYLSLQVHTRKCMALGLKKTGLGVNSVIGCTYFNEQGTLSFGFLFLHNEGLTLVILARPKILRGYFVQLLWKLITIYLAVGSPFQGHIFESFGKKKCDRAFLKSRGGAACEIILFFHNTSSLHCRKVRLFHPETLISFQKFYFWGFAEM